MRLFRWLAGVLCATALPILPQSRIDYARDVHPFLAARCFSCHSGDKRFSNLSVSTYRDLMKGGRTGKVVNPGLAAESLLLRRVEGDGVPVMPPAGEKLTANEIATIRAWIDQGARENENAAPARPIWIPKLALSCAPAKGDPVDLLIRRTFEKSGLAVPPTVADEVFLRRAYLDLWGLLPTPEQQDEFLSDHTPDKRIRLVERLLANNQNYADHWITYWNDLLRNDEGVNYIGARKSITTWLYQALVDNLSYDEFARRLLSPWRQDDPEGFVTGVNWRGDVNASQLPVIQAAQNSAQVFLGVNLKCNSCHDSFVSKWKLKDAYGLASFFSGVNLEMVRCDAKTGLIAKPQFLYPELGTVSDELALIERRQWVAALFTTPANGRFSRTIVNRLWKRLMGRGIIEPADDMDAEPWSAELLDTLACEFQSGGYNLKGLIRRIMTSRAYQLPSVDSPKSGEEAYTFRGPVMRRLTGEQFTDAVSSITGEWRARITPAGTVAERVRDWRLASNPLTRALGRPIRDQVFTERNQEPTTLQALELTNGETYTRMLRRAARRMLGELPPAPENLFDSGRVGADAKIVDIPITGLKQLRLIVIDVDSYSPERVKAVWADARFTGPNGETPVVKEAIPGKMRNVRFSDAIRVKAPSEFVLDIEAKGYTRFRAAVGVEEESLASDISPRIRFFVFAQAPDMERLVRVTGDVPVGAPEGPFTADSLTERIYRHALGRRPHDAEAVLARRLLSSGSRSEGLADLLWCVTMLPEFQLIR